jgi:bifunctional non-homologous end joining protein LigD
MSLDKYKEKRTFSKTPEPRGGKPEQDELWFVIQKHAASHLHYDFRLEMRGVLKSWAVPKGPSTDPDVKRLAMMVEDHPYDYRNFEGIIPKGQYGGGTVIVWDEGTYESVEAAGQDKKIQEKDLLKQLYSGKIKFRLKGKKLKGDFALVKAHGRGENGWLLMKLEDKYASPADILEKNKSIISRQTIEQVAKTSNNIYGETKKPVKKGATSEKKVASTKGVPKKTHSAPASKKTKLDKLLKKAVKSKFPASVSPMLATLVDKPFDRPGWLYEVKWDGYRALALMHKGKTELKSRNNKSFDKKFYPIHAALAKLDLNMVIDGEIVVLNENGLSNFGALQNWRSEADGELYYYVFDIIWWDGLNFSSLPCKDRKAILREALPSKSVIRISEHFEASGLEFFESARKIGLEGIIAKQEDSIYQSGERSRDWLKIKSNKRQEVVIGGYTRNEGSSKQFSSLLVGVYEGERFQYCGKIGTGFTDNMQREMMAKFKPLVTKKPPFDRLPDINKPSRFRPNPPDATATWLKPKLVCEVSYAEMTSDGVMRHPSFEGMRMDKGAKDVVQEKEKDTVQLVHGRKKLSAKKIIAATGKKERKTLLNPTDETQVRSINGHELKFSNLSKIYWPEVKVTKRDMLNYYYQVAPYILPYLIDRPHSLNRHPNGINGMSFYQKDITGKAPEWIKGFPYFSESDEQQKNFLVCTDESSLLYMASLGCIEINPWSSRIQSPDYPDWCIIDLDPGKKTMFEQVIKAAQVTKEVLDALNVPSFCKTSGSTGLHVYIPWGAKYTYEQSKEFARAVVHMVHHEIPTFTSLERTVSKRNGKMYLDFLQNRPQATIAAPYSLRPKPGATVSMPLHWDEVKRGLKMKDFTVFNAIERIKTEGDLFRKVLGKGINLEKVIKKFDNLVL